MTNKPDWQRDAERWLILPPALGQIAVAIPIFLILLFVGWLLGY